MEKNNYTITEFITEWLLDDYDKDCFNDIRLDLRDDEIGEADFWDYANSCFPEALQAFAKAQRECCIDAYIVSIRKPHIFHYLSGKRNR
jgi:hypothetical protein